MTTATTTAIVRHDSDAGFRAWATEFCKLLTDTGWRNTADTGQADFTIATKPANYLTPHYKIYEINDSLSATRPIFIRLEFGTGGSNVPAVNIFVGTGTNGAGTLTPGMVTLANAIFNNIEDIAVPYISRACKVDGCGWVAFKKMSGVNAALGGFCVARSADAAGVLTTNAVRLYVTISGNMRCIDLIFSINVVTPQHSAAAFLPGGYLSSVVAGDTQFWKHQIPTPLAQYLPYILTTNINDVPAGTVRTDVSVYGGAGRTFISVGPGLGLLTALGGSSLHQIMAIWE